ncbi:MAG TPA: polysaccharide biosynthesis tyrosine autokinase [Bacteroidia bacterium]|nr:polysaccharide biosynthesis tyrosine autokinase [Bacteroidia bacterium]
MDVTQQPIATSAENFYYIKSALQTAKRFWYLFAISVITFVGLAYFVNWYVQPTYEVGTVILMEEGKNPTPDASKEFMKSFSIFSPTSDIQKEILKMKSSELIFEVLKTTKAQITYYAKRGLKTRELYLESPFRVEMCNANSSEPVGIEFHIVPKSEKRFQLVVEKGEEQVQIFSYEKNKVNNITGPFNVNKEYAYGDTIKSDLYCFVVTCEQDKLADYDAESKFYFVFNDLTTLSYSYQKAIQIEQVAKDIQAASIKIKVKNPQKGIDFIDALTHAYLQHNLGKKNIIAQNTIEFFDKQLGILEDSLKRTEGNLQEFRSAHRAVDLSAQADQAIKGAGELENQRAELQAKAKYYNYINENLERDRNGSSLLVPSSMGINDNVLSGILEEYLRLNSERNNLIQNKQTQSPYFNTLTIKINNQKNTLSENIKYLINTNNIQLNEVENRLRKENAQISALPSTERKLVGIERQYKLNDNIYTYMLEKKAEAQVAKASNLTENDILESARLTQPGPVSPNKAINLAVGFFVGLFIPFAGFGIRSLMDDTISNEQAMQALTKIPSIGKISHNKGKKQSAVLIDAPKSAISESIRTVRTNIDYFLQGQRHKVILFTSTMSGEGKSFNSLNIALSFSLLNRKTILLDFDLRKPNSYQSEVVPEKELGLSSFLSGDATIDEIIVHSTIPSFDFIAAGPTPANPAELISSEKTEALIKQLKETYDYVIIDTPPLGLVTEAFLMMQYADLKIFVAREKVTPKKQLSNIMTEMESKKIENIYWLLNDVDMRDTYYGQSNYYTQG